MGLPSHRLFGIGKQKGVYIMTTIETKHIDELKNVIIDDYARFISRAVTLTDAEKAEKVSDFSKMQVTEGKLYYKVCNKRGGAWGFIVKKDNGKFKAGDILKAASWSSPAKNFARGNIFSNLSHFQWTGA